MIWSVSTSLRRSGTTVPVWTVKASMAVAPTHWGWSGQICGGREPPGDGGRGGDARGDEVGPAAGTLSSLEVAVGRARAPLAGGQGVGVHAEAHRAAGTAPLRPGGREDLVQALLLRLQLDQHRARHHEHPYALGHRTAADHVRGGAQILD